MESDNFESKEDVATALRCRDSVDDLRKEDLANLASLIDKDTNVEKTGASRRVVLAGIRETLELVTERTHGTLTKKQIRSISFSHCPVYLGTHRRWQTSSMYLDSAHFYYKMLWMQLWRNLWRTYLQRLLESKHVLAP